LPALTPPVREENAMPFDGAHFEALEKIYKVIDLLAREDRWCKRQLRTHDGRRCILGAMIDADATVVLREPILLAIKQVTGGDYGKVEVFNDSPSTSHGLVLRVLQQARDNVLSGRFVPPLASSVAASPSWTGVLRPWAGLQRLFA
jgi:hypothetical protein